MLPGHAKPLLEEQDLQQSPIASENIIANASSYELLEVQPRTYVTSPTKWVNPRFYDVFLALMCEYCEGSTENKTSTANL